MARRTGETIQAMVRDRILPADVLDRRIDARKDTRVHLVDHCTKGKNATAQDVTVAELVKDSCPSCDNEGALTADWAQPHPVSKRRQDLAALLEDGRRLSGYWEALNLTRTWTRAESRDLTPLEMARAAAGVLGRVRRASWRPELHDAQQRLIVAAQERAQAHLEKARGGRRGEELRKQVSTWWRGEGDCLLGLPGWCGVRLRGRDAEALELMVAFSVHHPDPEILLSRVPGWAVEFIIDRLGGRPELEMADDTTLTPGEQEILVALWPGMPLLEAIGTAQALA